MQFMIPISSTSWNMSFLSDFVRLWGVNFDPIFSALGGGHLPQLGSTSAIGSREGQITPPKTDRLKAGEWGGT